jgi:uncharacterized protein
MPTMPQFEWDTQKDRVNTLKHGITFEQAKTIWEQEILTDDDDRFDYDEQRFKATGLLRNLVGIVVIYTKR